MEQTMRHGERQMMKSPRAKRELVRPFEDSKWGITANKLKILAIIAMVVDHFVAVFFPHDLAWVMGIRVFGRIAAPLMCYFIAEGYHYTSDRKAYLKRLTLFALISHIPYNLYFGIPLNPRYGTGVIWALTMGLLALIFVNHKKMKPWLKVIGLVSCCLLAYSANWNYVAVLWVVAFGYFRDHLKKQIIAFTVIGIVFHLIPTYGLSFFTHETAYHWYQLGIFLAIPFLILYNGKIGKKSKALAWSFYIIYPLHLLVFYLIRLWLF